MAWFEGDRLEGRFCEVSCDVQQIQTGASGHEESCWLCTKVLRRQLVLLGFGGWDEVLGQVVYESRFSYLRQSQRNPRHSSLKARQEARCISNRHLQLSTYKYIGFEFSSLDFSASRVISTVGTRQY